MRLTRKPGNLPLRDANRRTAAGCFGSATGLCRPEKLCETTLADKEQQGVSIEINLGASDPNSWIASLTYRSEAADPPSPYVLDALLRSARARNHSAGITGMMVYDKGRFLQTLEGPPDALERVWSSILRDPRHRNIKVMSQQIVPARLFSEWDMQLFSRRETRQRSIPSARGPEQLTAQVPQLVRYVLAGDTSKLDAIVNEVIAAGWLSEMVVKHLIEPAARRLGDAFIADDCSEVDLTVGLGVLQVASHAIHRHPSATGGIPSSPYCIVVVPAPGEPHLLGPSLLGELLINAGWAVEIAFPETDEALARLLVEQQPDAIDIALSDALPRQHALDTLRRTIASCRTADLKSPVIVSVGGRAFAEFGATGASVGADHARSSAAGAIASLTKLVQHS